MKRGNRGTRGTGRGGGGPSKDNGSRGRNNHVNPNDRGRRNRAPRHSNALSVDRELGEPALPSNTDREARFATTAAQKEFEEFKKRRAKRRVELMRAGVIDDPNVPKPLSQAITMRGTCEQMCPEYDFLERVVHDDFSPPEYNAHGLPDRSLAVKKYRRPAAGMEDPLPDEIRSVKALVATTDHLFREVLVNYELPVAGNMLWDRTRGIRQDFSRQHYDGPEAVDCHEKIARFHILMMHLRLPEATPKGQGQEKWSFKQELEQYGNTFKTLHQYYEGDRVLPNRAEFFAYDLVTNFYGNIAFLDRYEQSEPPSIMKTPIVKRTIELLRLTKNKDDLSLGAFESFFNLIDDDKTPYLLACLFELYIFPRVRKAAYWDMWKDFRRTYFKGTRYLTLEWVKDILHYDSIEDVRTDCRYYGLDVREGVIDPPTLHKYRKGQIDNDQFAQMEEGMDDTVAVGSYVHSEKHSKQWPGMYLNPQAPTFSSTLEKKLKGRSLAQIIYHEGSSDGELHRPYGGKNTEPESADGQLGGNYVQINGNEGTKIEEVTLGSPKEESSDLVVSDSAEPTSFNRSVFIPPGVERLSDKSTNPNIANEVARPATISQKLTVDLSCSLKPEMKANESVSVNPFRTSKISTPNGIQQPVPSPSSASTLQAVKSSAFSFTPATAFAASNTQSVNPNSSFSYTPGAAFAASSNQKLATSSTFSYAPGAAFAASNSRTTPTSPFGFAASGTVAPGFEANNTQQIASTSVFGAIPTGNIAPAPSSSSEKEKQITDSDEKVSALEQASPPVHDAKSLFNRITYPKAASSAVENIAEVPQPVTQRLDGPALTPTPPGSSQPSPKPSSVQFLPSGSGASILPQSRPEKFPTNFFGSSSQSSTANPAEHPSQSPPVANGPSSPISHVLQERAVDSSATKEIVPVVQPPPPVQRDNFKDHVRSVIRGYMGQKSLFTQEELLGVIPLLIEKYAPKSYENWLVPDLQQFIWNWVRRAVTAWGGITMLVDRLRKPYNCEIEQTEKVLDEVLGEYVSITAREAYPDIKATLFYRERQHQKAQKKAQDLFYQWHKEAQNRFKRRDGNQRRAMLALALPKKKSKQEWTPVSCLDSQDLEFYHRHNTPVPLQEIFQPKVEEAFAQAEDSGNTWRLIMYNAHAQDEGSRWWFNKFMGNVINSTTTKTRKAKFVAQFDDPTLEQTRDVGGLIYGCSASYSVARPERFDKDREVLRRAVEQSLIHSRFAKLAISVVCYCSPVDDVPADPYGRDKQRTSGAGREQRIAQIKKALGFDRFNDKVIGREVILIETIDDLDLVPVISRFAEQVAATLHNPSPDTKRKRAMENDISTPRKRRSPELISSGTRPKQTSTSAPLVTQAAIKRTFNNHFKLQAMGIIPNNHLPPIHDYGINKSAGMATRDIGLSPPSPSQLSIYLEDVTRYVNEKPYAKNLAEFELSAEDKAYVEAEYAKLETKEQYPKLRLSL